MEDELRVLLHGLGLENRLETLIQHGITSCDLFSKLTEEDLKEMEFALGDRLKWREWNAVVHLSFRSHVQNR